MLIPEWAAMKQPLPITFWIGPIGPLSKTISKKPPFRTGSGYDLICISLIESHLVLRDPRSTRCLSVLKVRRLDNCLSRGPIFLTKFLKLIYYDQACCNVSVFLGFIALCSCAFTHRYFSCFGARKHFVKGLYGSCAVSL